MMIYKRRRITPAVLSKETGINRSTVYAATKRLIEIGLVAEDLAANNRKYYVARQPTNLIGLFEKEASQAQEKVSDAEDIVRELKNVERSKFQTLPKLRFVPEAGIKDFLYEQTSYWEASMKKVGDTTWWGFQDVDFPDRYSEWIDWYWSRAGKEFDLKLISGHSDTETFQDVLERHQKRRVLLPWQANPEFTSTLWVQGEYIVMLVLQQKPNYLIEIRDVLLAENLREVFKNLWDREVASTK